MQYAMDNVQKIAFVAIGAILSGAAYLLKRWIERKSAVEVLDRRKKVLEIHRQMSEQGLDVEGLKRLEDTLVGKSSAIRRHSKELSDQSLPLVYAEELTQEELNKRANEKLGRAKKKLQEVVDDIGNRVGDGKRQAFLRSQKAWKSYSTSHAEAVAASYKGGGIYSLIYLSELESLTLERIARLQAELDEIRKQSKLEPSQMGLTEGFPSRYGSTRRRSTKSRKKTSAAENSLHPKKC